MERKSEWADETERLFTDLSTRSTVREMEEQRLTLVSIACHPVPRLAQIGQKGTSFTTCGLEETVHCLSSCLCKSRTRQRWSSVWSLGGGRVFLFFISLFASLSLTSSSPRPPDFLSRGRMQFPCLSPSSTPLTRMPRDTRSSPATSPYL